jgi:hypothetical protein
MEKKDHIIVVFGISRMGNSSLEIALQKLGYNTMFINKGRAIANNKINQFDKFFSNIEKGKPFFDGIEENAFILGSHLRNNIVKLYEYYPDVKIICTDRNDNDWILSMKNHQIVANRPNPKRADLIKAKEYHKNTIANELLKIPYFDRKNYMEFNVDNNNKLERLCKFLDTNNPGFEYPHISTGIKIKLTEEQINY